MPRASAKKQNERAQRAINISAIAGMAGMALFAILAFTVLAGMNYSYLRKLEELNLFMSGASWFRDCMQVPGGLLTWCSTFLTQFFYYPWLGSAVITMLLLWLWWLVYRTFSLPRRFFVLAGIPSAMLLLAVLMPGYLIYTIKTPGFAYMGILGLASAVSLYGLYKDLRRAAWRAVMLLIIAAAYPLIGFYALFSALLCLLDEIAGRRVWWLMALCVLLALVVPQLYFYYAGSHLMLVSAYTSGLTRFVVDGFSFRCPYVVCFLLLALASLFGGKYRRPENDSPRDVIVASVFLVMAMVSVVVYRYDDKNFRNVVEMTLAIEDGDYAAAVASSRRLDVEPTRVNGLYTHLALFYMGQAGDSLFTFPMSDAAYASPSPDIALRVTCSRGLNYGFGRINDCYRWCMEDMVEYGPKVEYLKYMSKCALLNGEYNLARRYLRMLSRTLFHKDWAARYLAYADNPESMEDDPEFSILRPLTAYNSHICGDGGMIEVSLSANIAGLAGGPPPLVELSLQFNLVRKAIADFWPRFILYARTHDRLPVHYQEAAILFSTLERKVDWHRFKIDADVAARFNRFMELASRNSRNTEDTNREIFRPLFGDTYWFYYFFTTGLKTT